MKYSKGEKVQLRDSSTGVIVSTYESTRGYAVVLDGERVHLYRREDQIRGRIADVKCRCGHEHSGLCTRCDCIAPARDRIAWLSVVGLVSAVLAPFDRR